MAFRTLVGAVLVAWVLYSLRAVLFWRSPVLRASSPPRLCDPPQHLTPIPFLGHVLGIVFRGSNPYISSLCADQQAPIATMRLPGQDMHLIHPLSFPSIKRFTGMHNLSLMSVFRVAVGPAMALVPESEAFLTDPDTGSSKRALSKLFNAQLRELNNLRAYSAQIEQSIDEYWNASVLPGQGTELVKVGLSSWVFDQLSFALGDTFWGANGPFADAFFREQLRVFIQNLEALRNPIPFLVPRHIRSARAYVREKLDRAAENEEYGPQGQVPTMFARLAVLYGAHGVPPAGFTDCHLVAVVGLMSNVINGMAWTMCRIVADRQLMASLRAELDALVTQSNKELDVMLDLDQVKQSCPLLNAVWYEMLRTYGDSPVARYVYQNSAFDGQYQVKKGSIIMTPIHLHNFSTEIWGPDVDTFRPRRFLGEDGVTIDSKLVKHLEVFGLPGMHQCPGRYLAMNLTLGLVAKALLTFDITAIGHTDILVPGRQETMLGLPATASDPEIHLKRRQPFRAVTIRF